MNDIDYLDEKKIECLLLPCGLDMTVILPTPCVAEIIPHFEFVAAEKANVIGHIRWRHTILDLLDIGAMMQCEDSILPEHIKSVAIINAVIAHTEQKFWAIPLSRMPETIQVSHVDLSPQEVDVRSEYGEWVIYENKKFILPDLQMIQRSTV